MTKRWRDASSLIIAAPSERTQEKFSTDYQILFLKRGAKSASFANAYVYPGGLIDDADKSSQWIDVFMKIDESFCDNVSKEFFAKQTDGKRLPIFPGDENALKNGLLPNEIAFRICAIRETFEESGLLFLTSNVHARRQSSNAIHAKSLTSLLSNNAVEEWRKKIHGDAKEFMNLCVQLEKVPDIWSLKEWFHTLTPLLPGGRIRKRYNTVFYSCCLQEAPSYFHHDKVEMSATLWISPGKMIEMYLAKKEYLAPPQILQALGLLRFTTFESLATYMNRRALKGLSSIMPYLFLTKDGKMLGVMPGDDRYPEDPEETGEGKKAFDVLPETLQEVLMSKGNRFHYTVQLGDPSPILDTLSCNVTLPYGLVAPLIPQSLEGQLAKL